MNAYQHSKSSAKKWGGSWEDYHELHNWMDSSKASMGDIRHRALRHHTQGLFDAEQIFGPVWEISTGKKIPTREILERHICEDLGYIPTLSDWLREMPMQVWMSGQKRVKVKTIKLTEENNE